MESNLNVPRHLLAAVATLLFALQAEALSCKATYRFPSSTGISSNEAALTVENEGPASSVLHATLHGFDYYLTYDKTNQDGLLQIIDSTDETQGMVARSTFNSRNYMSLASVKGETVRKIECLKQ